MLAILRPLLIGAGAILISAVSAHAADTDKLPVRGLISMGPYEFVGEGGQPKNTLAPLRARSGVFGGIVVVASWQQLQHQRNGPLTENNVIDRMLVQIRTYNTNHPNRQLAVKLRVWGGFMAPEWAKKIGGPPIPAIHKNHDRTVGRFWSQDYRTAFADLQTKLAARYDGDPLISEVAITQCMSFTSEPFFLPSDVFATLRLVGFNDKDYRDCLMQAVADYAPWQQTKVVYALNPYNFTGTGPGDLTYTAQVMAACRTAFGPRCVLDNHDLNDPPLHQIVPLYDLMRMTDAQIEFQTYNAIPHDFPGTIRLGVGLRASGIELYQDYGGFQCVSTAQLKQWAQLIERNARAPVPAASRADARIPICAKAARRGDVRP